jgi:lysophospholipase L1-like esterase
MKPPLSRGFLLLLIVILVVADLSSQIQHRHSFVLTIPIVPNGVNPATVPVPQVDWLYHFKDNLGRAKGKQIDLVFDGDSITEHILGTGGEDFWEKNFAPLHAFNFGIGGDRIEHVLWRVQNGQLDGLNPKLVILLIGTNNISRGQKADAIAEGITNLLGEYEKRCPKSHILLMGIFPRGATPEDNGRKTAEQVNELLKKSIRGRQVTYLDLSANFLEPDGTLSKDMMYDGIHPTPKGYQVWADGIAPIIKQYFPERPSARSSQR